MTSLTVLFILIAVLEMDQTAIIIKLHMLVQLKPRDDITHGLVCTDCSSRNGLNCNQYKTSHVSVTETKRWHHSWSCLHWLQFLKQTELQSVENFTLVQLKPRDDITHGLECWRLRLSPEASEARYAHHTMQPEYHTAQNTKYIIIIINLFSLSVCL